MALATLTGIVERLTEKVEDLQRAQAASAETSQRENHANHIDRLLNGRSSSLVNVLSSLVTVGPLLGTLALGLLGRLPHPPGTVPAWSLWDVVRPLLPVAAAIALAALLILASRFLKWKTLRLNVVTTVMTCYSTATVLYLAWLSLAFLRVNTLPGDVLLTLSWVAIIMILRRVPIEVSEMRELVRLQMEKGEKQKTALLGKQ